MTVAEGSSDRRSGTGLELRGIRKRFGDVVALKEANLIVPGGRIMGLVGENGAGKSTLMNVACGLIGRDAGEILIGGREAGIASPREAIRAGVGMVHQHFLLIDRFTALENVLLGHEGSVWLRRGTLSARLALARMAEEHGLGVDPDARVEDLPVGQQQRVEILKVLHRGADILILDEPTAVLTPAEADALFVALRRLASRGVTVVLVTHKLREIMDVTDRVAVMRRGEVVAEIETAATSASELARLMVGGAAPAPVAPSVAQAGEPTVEVTGLGLRDRRTGVALLQDVSFEMRAGEILGVAGVSGNGQTELLQVLAGMVPPDSGSFRVGGLRVSPERPATPLQIRSAGVAHVPEDRHRHGIVPSFPAFETAMLGRQRERTFGPMLVDWRAAETDCRHRMEMFDVRPRSPRHRSALFSGGNQQKLVMARETTRIPRVLLAGQPTRGVDVGAIAVIHERLSALRTAGCAVLLVSAELDELAALADRTIVMFAGRIAGVLGPRPDPAEIGFLMAGGDGLSSPAAVGTPAP